MKPVLKILTDYPRDDLAHDEVHQSLVAACLKYKVDAANIDVGAVPGMDTVTAGFKTAQLALNSQIGFGHVFHTNCAPRKHIVTARSQGEKIVLGVHKNGVCVLMVNAGYALSPFRDSVLAGDMTFYQTAVPDAGSQFRSRDFFPDALAELAAHLMAHKKVEGLSWLGAPLSEKALPALPPGTVYYIDNFGNIKLNLAHADIRKRYEVGEILAVKIGNIVCDAVVGEAGFSQGEGMLALTAGSSGWAVKGEKRPFAEVFLRGGSAAGRFDNTANPGDVAVLLRESDLKKAVDILRHAEQEVLEKLDMHDISEARVIALLARKKLITDGCDTAELQKAFVAGDLLARIA